MRKWQDLQKVLEDLLNLKHVYYQPPENLKMEYPAIRYSTSKIDSKYANNSRYLGFKAYDIIVISKKKDHEVIQKILELPMSSYERHYVSDSLNHDLIRLYY